MSILSARSVEFWTPRVNSIAKNYFEHLFRTPGRPHPEFLEMVSLAVIRFLELAYQIGALETTLLLSKMDLILRELLSGAATWEEKRQELQGNLEELDAVWPAELERCQAGQSQTAGQAEQPSATLPDQPAEGAPPETAPAATPQEIGEALDTGETPGDGEYDGRFGYIKKDQFDFELLVIFLSETSEALPRIEQLLLEYESDPANLGLVRELFRYVHTVKGNAGFLGLQEFITLTHAMEQYLDLIRSGKTQSVQTDLLLSGLDALIKLLSNVQNRFDAENAGEPLGEFAAVEWRSLADAFYALSPD